MKAIWEFLVDFWKAPTDMKFQLVGSFALIVLIIALLALWFRDCLPAYLSGATVLDLPAFCISR